MPLSKASRFMASALVAAIIVAASGLWWLATRSSAIPFLPSHEPAQWIVYPMPADWVAYKNIEFSTEFRRAFVLERAPAKAALSLMSFHGCSLLINGQHVARPTTMPNWKRPTEVDALGLLRAGTNEISVKVTNAAGPPALWLSLTAGAVELGTDTNWEASYAGAIWKPAALASTPPRIVKGSLMYGAETIPTSLRARFPLYALCLLLAGGLAWAARWWMAEGRAGRGFFSQVPSARWPLIAAGVLGIAWLLLWSNNMAMLPLSQGFDTSSHVSYVEYILNHRALPLANEGFEMYQPPLYYLLSAGALALFHCAPSDPDGIFVLRLFGMVCGMAACAFVLLSLRLLFPEHPRRHFFGLLIAGLLPPNLYLCQLITNEILVTTLVAASVYLCLRIITRPQAGLGAYAAAGVAMGAALLAKSSAIVAPPLILTALGWNLWARRIRSPLKWAACLGTALGCCLVVSGWHYARVTARFGNPLVGNWDAVSGFNWWQQPGYHTAAYFFSFGECLVHPFYSAFNSLPDGIYSTLWGDGLAAGAVDLRTRPPWNYDLMAVGYLLALLPMAAIVAGVVCLLVEFIRHPNPAGFLALGLISLLGLLMIFYSIKVPSYAAGKAFYASAMLVPICIAGAVGCDLLVRRARSWRLAFCAVLGLWAVNTYASFWIRKDTPAAGLLVARHLILGNHREQAAVRITEVLKRDPQNSAALRMLAQELIDQGRLEEARTLAESGVRASPENADWHLTLGTILFGQKQLDRAVLEARRSAELAPDHPLAVQRLAEWLFVSGRQVESVTYCRDALRINPVSPKLHYLLGLGLTAQGRTAAAVEQYRESLLLDPDFAPALDRMAWVLATHPDAGLRNGREAVRLAAKACELNSRKSAAYLETLAAAYGEAGRFDDAIATARQAGEAAQRTGDKESAGLSDRLIELFHSARPYRQELPTSGPSTN
jgi:tetratricopeptide (TPR) repeat protein